MLTRRVHTYIQESHQFEKANHHFKRRHSLVNSRVLINIGGDTGTNAGAEEIWLQKLRDDKALVTYARRPLTKLLQL